MNCNDVAAILDSNRSAQMTAAERATVDVHLSTCEDCDAAWHGQTELLALRVPAMPATLLERALRAARVPPIAQPRHAFRPIAIGATLLAGAALATMTIVSLTDSPSAGIPPSTDGEPSAQVDAALVDAAPAGATAGATATPDLATSVELVETALSIAPIVRHPPDYPLEALKQRLGGHVQLKFDVTAAGIVENVSVVESSDAQFEEPAIRALSEWRYLPRIVAGERVAANGIHTIIRWEAPSDANPPPDQRQTDAKQEADMRGFIAFSDDLKVALDRLAADDLRGAELQLDQMLAVYPASGFFHGDIWKFYGYLFTVQRNYDRAIDAYESGLVAYARNGAQASMSPWVPLANLYFARHQYDLALNTLVRMRAGGSSGRLSPEADTLIVKLRDLGLTHESLETR
jgi:TonB family protein